MFTIDSAEGYEELLQATGDTSPYDFRSIFQPQGTFGKRRERQRLKLLKNMDSRIRETLQDGERVSFISWGMRNSPWSQAFVGWIVYYLNQRALVLTDRRLLIFQITTRRKAGEFIKQITLGAMEYARQRGFFGLFRIRTQARRSVDFLRMPRTDMRRLADMLTAAIAARKVPAGPGEGIQNLCPSCKQVVDGFPPACPGCGQAFKRPLTAGGLSLAFPGLGDIYLGHYSMAALEALLGLVLWIGILLPDGSSATPMPLWARGIGGLIVLVPFVHLPDAIGTYMIARKGLTPARTRSSNRFGVTELKRTG